MRVGYRRKTSDIAHLPWWFTRGTVSNGSACGQISWQDDDVWWAEDGFDPDGTVRLCARCRHRAVKNVTTLLRYLSEWGQEVQP